MLGHEQKPDLENYTAFVVGMKGTIVQFVKSDLPNSYIRDLRIRLIADIPKPHWKLASLSPMTS